MNPATIEVIDDRIRLLEERIDELRALRESLTGEASEPSPGKAEAPTGAEPPIDSEDQDSEAEVRKRRAICQWPRAVPKTDLERVQAIVAVMTRHEAPIFYRDLLKALHGWRSMDVANVLKQHPENFTQTQSPSGRKFWELLTSDHDPATFGTIEPPPGMEPRCRAIAATLRDGPLFPHAIAERLHWSKSYVSSTLTRQSHSPEPWFHNQDRGWTLTDWGRGQIEKHQPPIESIPCSTNGKS